MPASKITGTWKEMDSVRGRGRELTLRFRVRRCSGQHYDAAAGASVPAAAAGSPASFFSTHFPRDRPPPSRRNAGTATWARTVGRGGTRAISPENARRAAAGGGGGGGAPSSRNNIINTSYLFCSAYTSSSSAAGGRTYLEIIYIYIYIC